MTNIQHSCETGEWYTPDKWVSASREVLGGAIGIDPCGSPASNKVIGAVTVFGDTDYSLLSSWNEHGTAFVNPPGACTRSLGKFLVCGNRKRCSCKLPKHFLEKCIAEANMGLDVVYLAYSVNQLRHLASMEIPEGLTMSVALPRTRIAYVDPVTMKPQRGTNCDSAFILLTKDTSTLYRFTRVFGDLGCMVLNAVP